MTYRHVLGRTARKISPASPRSSKRALALTLASVGGMCMASLLPAFTYTGSLPEEAGVVLGVVMFSWSVVYNARIHEDDDDGGEQ